MSKEKNFVNQNIGQQDRNIYTDASIIIDTNDDDVDNDSDVDIYEKIRKQVCPYCLFVCLFLDHGLIICPFFIFYFFGFTTYNHIG